MAVKPIPEGHHTVTPYLIVKDAAAAIEFYKQAFGATELMRLSQPDGKVGHAELRLGDSLLMLADEFPEMGARGPKAYGGSAVILAVYVEDVDAQAARAMAAGAKVLRPVQDQFYGDRTGTFEDPFGHIWTLATHKEDVSPQEINKRFEAAMRQQGG
jgi:PhnB protein